ncbi:putative Ig domain-containing protein, partial [Nocardioides zeicaulis]
PVPTTAPTPVVSLWLSPLRGVRVTSTSGGVAGAGVGKRFKARVTVTGGAGTFTWSRRGGLPHGLRGATSATGDSYVITGRPKRAGTVAFTVTVTDSAGTVSTRRYRIRVR